jgi:hypothetical protein
MVRLGQDNILRALTAFVACDDMLRHIVRDREIALKDRFAVTRTAEGLLRNFFYDLTLTLGYHLPSKQEDRRFAVALNAFGLVYVAVLLDELDLAEGGDSVRLVRKAYAEPSGLLFGFSDADLDDILTDGLLVLRGCGLREVKKVSVAVMSDLMMLARGAGPADRVRMAARMIGDLQKLVPARNRCETSSVPIYMHPDADMAVARDALTNG